MKKTIDNKKTIEILLITIVFVGLIISGIFLINSTDVGQSSYQHVLKIIDKHMPHEKLNSPNVNESMRALVTAWSYLRDGNTGVFPDNTFENRYIYSPSDSGADIFPWMYIYAYYHNEKMYRDLKNTLAYQKTLRGKYYFLKQSRQTKNISYEVSEYLKDGMVPILEFFQDREDYEYMKKEILNLNITYNPEIDGEMLITISRLLNYKWDEEVYNKGLSIYLNYIFGELQSPNQYVPTMRLTDHGNEIIVGLTEFAMLRNITDYEDFTISNMLYHSTTNLKLCKDTCGYILSAYYSYNKESATPVIEKYIDELDINDFTSSQDSMADVAEGLIYLAPYFDVDDKLDLFITTLLSTQRKDGFYTRWHADGNILRTLLMYEIYKGNLEFEGGLSDYPRINGIK